MSETQAPPVPADGTRTVALISYALFIAAFMNGITAIVGVVLAYIKRDEARGTIWESHFANLIHVFWVGIVVFALFLAALIAGIGGVVSASEHDQFSGLIAFLPLAWLGGVLFVVWYLYRTIKGVMRAMDGKAYS